MRGAKTILIDAGCGDKMDAKQRDIYGLDRTRHLDDALAELVTHLRQIGSFAYGAAMTTLIVLIALTFWFTKFDNNVTILQALLDAGRYPATVYPVWLRIIVTYLIPIAVATTVPLQALRGDLNLIRILMFIGISIASFLVASKVWKAGLKGYSGASS